MTTPTIDHARRRAARIAGAIYLVTMSTAMVAELAVRGRLIVTGDAAQTAKSILASQQLFRLGTVLDVITYAGVVGLVWALYIVLEPVSSSGVVLAAFFRVPEIAICAVSTVNAHAALRLVSAEYLRHADPQQMQALARLFAGLQGAGLYTAFVFLGLGSTVFSVLWLKSRYVPAPLAWLGIFASLLLATGSLVVIAFPAVGSAVGMAWMAPMFFYEVGLGLWLVIKGI